MDATEYNSSPGPNATDARVPAGAFAHAHGLKSISPPPPSQHPSVKPSRGPEAMLDGSGGRAEAEWCGSRRAGGMAGGLQSARAAAAERAAPGRARGECVFAIISIITTS